MRLDDVFIPYGAYWSTPFCKWQGSLSTVNSIRLAAQAAKQAMAARDIPIDKIGSLTLGMTVPQQHGLYGAPWLAALIGNDRITGTMVAQACATGARALATSGSSIATGAQTSVLSITTDRCSNGPHIYYPNPSGPGGTGDTEDWVMDSFGHDPYARNAMIQTAENVAAEQKISREQQDALTVHRYAQYERALADNNAFQKRYMLWPFEVKDARGRKTIASIEGDEGVFATTADGLAKLKPVIPDGTVTFGSQTHPADGSCGMIVCDRERAKAWSQNRDVKIRLLSYAQARTDKGFMAKATAPAAESALDCAGLRLDKVDAIKTHNPFAVNDIYLARELGIEAESFNNYGSSLIYGHPQGPTGMRLIIELIEELAIKGGGYGLFVGCAAGDTAAAITLKVG